MGHTNIFRRFFWAAGFPGVLLLLQPVITVLVSRRRDLADAIVLDTSSLIQAGYTVICALVALEGIKGIRNDLFHKLAFRSPLKYTFWYTALCAVSSFWSIYPLLTIYRSVESFTFLLLLVVVVQSLIERHSVTEVLKWVVFFAFWNLMIGILLRYKFYGIECLSIPFLPSRLFFPLFFFLIILHGKSALPKLVTIIVIVCGLSNKIFIGIALGFLCYALGTDKNKKLLTGLALVAFCGTWLFGVEEMLLQSLFYGREFIGLEDTSGRGTFWQHLIGRGLERPLYGYGFVAGESYLLNEIYTKGVIGAHNCFISAFVSVGIVGVVLIAALFYRTLKLSLAFKSRAIRTSFSATIVLVIFVSATAPGIGGRVYGSWIPSIFLVCLVSALYIKDRERRITPLKK